MNTCLTCKYWNTSRKIVNKVSNCDLPDCIIPKGKPTMEIEADAADDTNLSAVLMTSEDFGCILHTPKTNT